MRCVCWSARCRGTQSSRGWGEEGSVPHGTVFGLNDGGENVSPCTAEAVSGELEMKISRVWGCKIVQSFVGDEEDHEVDALPCGYTMKMMDDTTNAFSGVGVGEQLGSWVLNIL